MRILLFFLLLPLIPVNIIAQYSNYCTVTPIEKRNHDFQIYFKHDLQTQVFCYIQDEMSEKIDKKVFTIEQASNIIESIKTKPAKNKELRAK